MTHRSAAEIEAGLEAVAAAPGDGGSVKLVVRRPAPGERELLEEAELDVERGLIGDDWINRPGLGSELPSPYAQVTLMNVRYTELIAGSDPAAWALAGDQLYVELDLSQANLPPGTRIRVGEALLEVQPEPHTGCARFSQRFGSDALRIANSPRGRELRLRGVNATVIEGGTVRRGDLARREVAAAVG